ncbi:AAA family ATPase [Neobacillus sp. OS1-32]|uniref:AAA family ATPase n=1 Tax=Neobacillus sp. OS1-32 TaxID=3070682 RepID=UPI0027DF1040|nr:AAA family ATPase [Neobacillus sp. OS1-32]WML31997.1 AAA family ATPase [Neobacillus sp. OS1-32]
MEKIIVHFFGNYRTTVDNKRIIFPYGKAEALFYYLVVNKYASRDQLANLLWADMEDKIAKKNLRNALYTLKKLFKDIEVFSYNGLSAVCLNPDVIIESDYDEFIQNDHNVEVFKGEFLQGMTVKDAVEFERWMYKVRDECNFIYSERLWNQLTEHKQNKNYFQLENICRKIIELDEYDESGYIELMNCYKEQQKYSNAIVIYNDLSDLLLRELDIAPNDETQKVYNEILDLMNEREKVKISQKFFIGRDQEKRLLKNIYDSFIKNEPYHSILIRSAMGVGKTRLKEYFVTEITDKTVNIVEANCYKFEENYVLRPWKTILVNILKVVKAEKMILPLSLLDVLGTFAPEFESYKKELLNRPTHDSEAHKLFEIEDVIVEVLKVVSSRKKLILVFEDIHWMDARSMRLLDSLLVNDEMNNCLFFLTTRNEMNSELEKFLVYINHYAKVKMIELNAFNEDEVKRFIDRALPQEKITRNLLEEIYHETEGNAFFLTEYIHAIMNHQSNDGLTPRMQDVLKFRFIDLNEIEKKLVEIASLFYDEVSISVLKEFIDLDELEIIEVAEGLVEKGFLKEITYQRDICYSFVHQKLREFQYMQIPTGKKRILHNRIGKLLECNLKNNLSDNNIYHKLIYHFERACNDIELLRYRIKSLSTFLNFIHERFPTINFDNESFSKLYIGEEHIEQNLTSLMALLEKVKDDFPLNEEIPIFEMNVLFLNGRFNIRRGYYERGLIEIEQVIKLAAKLKQYDFVLKGYEQKIIYAIQTCDTKVLGQVLAQAEPIMQQNSTEKYKNGIWLRYWGMYEFLKRNFKQAEEYFRESISIHTQDIETYEKYRLNIAACYRNIGVIRMEHGDYAGALHYFERAISICDEKNLWISLSLFKTNAGVACYYLKDYSQAKEHLQSALSIYNKLAYNLSQPIAEIYMCLLLLMEKDYQNALSYLMKAEEHAQILRNPQELISLLELKKSIVNAMETDKGLFNTFEKYLSDFDCATCEEKKRKLMEQPSLVS